MALTLVAPLLSAKEKPMNHETQATAADILRAAANKLREVGWVQGAALSADGSMCALGSIASVTECEVTSKGIWSNTGAFLVANSVLTDWLDECLGDTSSVVGWNDTPGRTMDDVVTGMEKAAAWVEEQA